MGRPLGQALNSALRRLRRTLFPHRPPDAAWTTEVHAVSGDAREVLAQAMRPFYGAEYLDTVVDTAVTALAEAGLLDD